MEKDRICFDLIVIFVTSACLFIYVSLCGSELGVELSSILLLAAAPIALEALLFLIYFFGLPSKRKAPLLIIGSIVAIFLVFFILYISDLLKEKDVYILFFGYCLTRIVKMSLSLFFKNKCNQ